MKKDSAREFLNLTATGRVQEAFDKFVSPDFIHHNQYFKGDRQSLLEAMLEAHRHTPNKSIEIKNLFEDGDYVIAHSQVLRKENELPAIAVVHIFKFASGKVTELWDLGQEINKNSPNENGAF